MTQDPRVSLWTIAREWTRIGCIGFGGPPAHIALLRQRCVEERAWIEPSEFEDGIAAVNLLPGPASTQLAIFCRVAPSRPIGGILGGICFIVPGLILILCLSAVFLAHRPPQWILGTAIGAGAVVPAVALNTARGFVPSSLERMGTRRSTRLRWFAFACAGGAAAATIGTYLVVVLLACGLIEVALRTKLERRRALVGALVPHAFAVGGIGALAWIALKVGALSYGGGFVIIPLMQHDAVSTYHWMTGQQFLNAVALGQVTPGPVVLTTAVVGYAAAGLGGGLLATLIAFMPSFCFVFFGGPHFDRFRVNETAQSFLSGAGPATIGAIAGSSIPLGLAFGHLWQIPVLGGALLWIFIARRGVVSALLLGGSVGALVALSGVGV